MLTNTRIDTTTIVDLSLDVEYLSEHGSHRDVVHLENFNIVKSGYLLPLKIQKALADKKAGYCEVFNFKKGELFENHHRLPVSTLNDEYFNRHPAMNMSIEPRLGRFYPAGWFSGINKMHIEKMQPARIVSMTNDMISVDFNHPLTEYDVEIGIEVYNVYTGSDGSDEINKELIANLLRGPGMQLRFENKPTDFFSDEPFNRADETMDGLFYTSPRMVNHLDATALEQVKLLYSKLVPGNAHILDLMSSMNSHLPENINAKKVTGLGLNQQELENNPLLDEKIVHDLNEDTVMPFDDASFDVVLCTVSIEYLSRPIEAFSEISRILKPGGLFISTFSNRWFPTKAIRLWSNLHEFERMGLVREYLMRNGDFKNINTQSIRGLTRPDNDRHALPFSDPVYAVWGTKL